MLPRMCFGFDRLLQRKKKDEDREMVGHVAVNVNGRDLHCQSVICNRKLAAGIRKQNGCPLRCDKLRDRNEEIKERKREMANKVGHISGLIHRVASSCLTHHLPHHVDGHSISSSSSEAELEQELRSGGGEVQETEELVEQVVAAEEESSEGINSIWGGEGPVLERLKEMESLMSQVFGTVSAVKKAYVSLQEAHCPWDPEKMRVSDAAVVAELRRLGRLRDQFRRAGLGLGGGAAAAAAAAPLREVVAPYEAALEDLRRELRAREVEVESLKEKLVRATTTGSGRKGRIHYGKRVGCISGLGTPVTPTPELFETCMEEVKSATKFFTAHLLSLMRSAHWDITAAARSIIDSSTTNATSVVDHLTMPITVDPRHSKHALESYVTRKLFHGFENETFYIDGSLASLLRPVDFRRDCFAQFRDMRSMDPTEILGILPTCQFGKFAGKKYLSLMHPKMEESLFGGVEQRRQVMGGTHPRTGFYGEFLRAAKAVWMLHLVAFALDPPPSHFEAGKGAEFHPEYMESVVRFNGGGGGGTNGWVVGFPVGPGFKLGNGEVVRARVYLVPRVRDM